jgi:hypothetical protein
MPSDVRRRVRQARGAMSLGPSPPAPPELLPDGTTYQELETARATLESALGCDGVRVGDYLCRLPPLSYGGSAEVYVAEHVETGTLSALKLAKPGLEGAHAIFREEHLIGTRLHHQSILTSSALGRHDDGRPYLVLPLLSGSTLADDRKRHAEPRAAARLMITIARAVEFAHRRLVLHCDLKAENILLDDAGEPHVADFGLARRIQASRSSSGEAWGGTRGWTSPEQLEGKPVGVETDVFSLGVMLHYLLRRGELPFGKAKTYARRATSGRRLSPLPPSCLGRPLQRDLAAICRKALEPRWENRYSSAEAFANDLERALLCQPLEDETQRRRRALKWFKRHWVVSLLLVELAAVAAAVPGMLDGALSEVRHTIRTQNEFSARAQAGATHGELRALAMRIHAMSLDPNVRALLNHAGITVPARALAEYAGDFDSVNVFTAHGVHSARFPTSSVPSAEDVRYKDFFRCASEIASALAAERKNAPELPVCVARTHRSGLDDKVKVGISAPILDGGRLLGVAEGSTKARDRFRGIQMSCSGGACFTALLGLRDRENAAERLPRSLSVLAQAGLAEGAEVPLSQDQSSLICSKLHCEPEPLLAFASEQRGGATLLEHYVDPVSGTAAIAAIAPVGATGLSVLVATPDTAPSAQIERILTVVRELGLFPALLGLIAWIALMLSPSSRPALGKQLAVQKE